MTIEPGPASSASCSAWSPKGSPRATCPTGRRRTTHPSRWPADLRAVGAEVGLDHPPRGAVRALLLWATVVGGTSLEVFGQYGADTFRDPGQAYDQQVRMALACSAAASTTPDCPTSRLYCDLLTRQVASGRAWMGE